MVYDLKTAIVTSVFIMSFTALTGTAVHIIHGGTDVLDLIICVVFAIVDSRGSAKFANKANNKKLNKVSGVF
ncbi:hypothetical protein [Clostridium sardiniense]|uniref:hypothetical protein n=1 Tax=Clostridium sardiniense TaxID=29369 RepID=UPI00195767CC|nr:hypothetical protein [Clostridium sardiniense]MBM7833670.1 putative membrane protein YfcA [Clostridium sardiniense]